MSVLTDAQFVADHAELAARSVTAWLYAPMLPDEFWAEFHAGLTRELADFFADCSNARAVMADATQPIGMES